MVEQQETVTKADVLKSLAEARQRLDDSAERVLAMFDTLLSEIYGMLDGVSSKVNSMKYQD